MGLHILSHGEGYKGVFQVKHIKIANRDISIYNRRGSSRAKLKFVVMKRPTLMVPVAV